MQLGQAVSILGTAEDTLVHGPRIALIKAIEINLIPIRWSLSVINQIPLFSSICQIRTWMVIYQKQL